MKHLVFWFDPISPFAHLAFARLPELLQGHSVEVSYRPILLAGLLAHWGQKGPAEIEPKRAWTFRHVHWLAAQQGTPLATPAQHPFNPLALSRLMLAAGPNRRVVDAVLRHVWQGGADANDPDRLADLQAELALGPQPLRDPNGAEVKAELRQNTDAAIALGIFGVPTVELDGRLFWGLDGLHMLASALRGDAWFDGPAWQREGAARDGVQRR
jgi:2-hydroxychromene-2-carboxylate isomerase